MTTFIHEPDADGEPTIWAAIAGTDETVHLGIWRRCELPPEVRHHWDELVERITGEKPLKPIMFVNDPDGVLLVGDPNKTLRIEDICPHDCSTGITVFERGVATMVWRCDECGFEQDVEP